MSLIIVVKAGIPMAKYEIGVLGCGIAGFFTAYTLLKNGINVVVIDKDSLNYGATPFSAGVITIQLDEASEIRAAKRSLELYYEIGKIKGLDKLGIVNKGFLTIDKEKYIREYADLLLQEGVRFKIYNSCEIRELYDNDIIMYEEEQAIYTDVDLSCEPRILIAELRRLLREMGAHYISGEVRNLRFKGEEVVGVLVDNRLIKAKDYILTLGPFTKQVLSLYYPVFILKCPAFRFSVNINSRLPGISDERVHSYWRLGLNSTIVGGGYHATLVEQASEAYGEPLPEHYKYAKRFLEKRFRGGKEAKLIEGWCGPCSVSEDYKPLVGRFAKNLYMIEGLRGYGLMLGPALAESLALIVIDKKDIIDISEYDVIRFGDDYAYSPLKE